jgi:predicted dehydrogenase
MPDNVKDVILVGAGIMAQDYAKVLSSQNYTFTVIGRSLASAAIFKEQTGVDVITGGLKEYLKGKSALPDIAIVAVGVEQLAVTTTMLLERGVKRILVEKPAGIDTEEIALIARFAKKQTAQVFVAYNRRFYAATIKAREIIAADGGVTSFNFEFTEWSHVIEPLEADPVVKNNWFLANSTHVVDLAFFLGGEPCEISSYTAGGLSWHPSAAVFAGAGITGMGALFSYQANWAAPGRWGVEMLTNRHRLIFRPMEQLHIQEIGSVAISKVEIYDELDQQFKPGLYRQVDSFLSSPVSEDLLSIDDHLTRTEQIYTKIAHSHK